MSSEMYRAIVVEDDLDVLFFVRTVLMRRGFDVVALSDPLLARQAVVDFSPDVVITDIEMPGLSGLDLIAQVREAQPGTPVAVMTAHVSVNYAVSALRNSADEFMTKPIASAELVGVATRLAEEFRRAQAAVNRNVVLAIGAHPDDVEIGVGGLLAAHRAAGDSVAILTLSRGERGGEGDGRQDESLSAADILGARLFLEDLPDTAISSTDPTVGIIERVVDEIHPTIVYTHSSHDLHQDHRAVHAAALVATRRVKTVACFQSPSSTVEFRPNRFATIDGFTDKKLALLACFASQSGIRDYLEPDFVLATARYWSRFGSGKNCEPLEIVREAAEIAATHADIETAVRAERHRA